MIPYLLRAVHDFSPEGSMTEAHHTYERPDRDAARVAGEALRRHIAFLEEIAADPDVPRPERLRALELLAQIAAAAEPSERARGKSAGKHVAEHVAKHAGRHTAEVAAKHAPADRALARGGPRRLADPGATRRLSPGPDGSRALPSGA